MSGLHDEDPAYGNWAPVPGKEPRRRVMQVGRYIEFEAALKTQLKECTKADLISEVRRLQMLVRNIAVELGICRNKKTSEYAFDSHFVGNIITLIKQAGHNLGVKND